MKQGWEIKPLKDFLEVHNGYAFNSKLFNDTDGMPLIRIRDLKNGRNTKVKFVGEYDEKYVVTKGDFLIGMDGEFGCYEWIGNDALLNQRVCRLQDFKNDLLPKFLFYGINKYLKDIEDVTTYTTVKHISSKQIKGITFPIPPLDEQKRIVSKLDECFEAIDKACFNVEKNLNNAKELFQSQLNQSFSQRGEVWVDKKLGEVCENLDSRRIPITKNKRVSGDIPYYGASGIVDYVADFIFDEDLLLVSEDGANLLARVYPIAFSISGKTWINNHAHVLKFEEFVSQSFMEYYLNSIKLDDYVSGMAQPKLNQKMLNSIPVPYPSLKTQSETVTQLDALREQTQSLESNYQQELNALDELKKSILQKAFNGEL